MKPPAPVLGALLLWLAFAGPTQAAPALNPQIEAFIAGMVQQHQFRRERLRRIFSQARIRPAILRAISTPGTARPWYEFRSRHVDPVRIAGGVQFWLDNEATLARATREYGVPEEIIVATLGIETLYGRNTGGFKVIDALTTLAFGYPPRAKHFRSELEEFLLMTRESRLDPLAVTGSYAGAMGMPQFLPSSYRKYAVDFDGDGKCDLWTDAADAIGSIANYYRAYGWREGGAVVVPVVPGEADVQDLLDAGIKPHIKVGELRRRGVVPVRRVADDADAALFSVETEGGPQYWLGLDNFYVITRYNRSVNYAMAIHELARELRRLRLVDDDNKVNKNNY